MHELGNAGIRGILSSRLEGTGIGYSVMETDGENTKIAMTNSVFEVEFCMPSKCQELPAVADRMADIARNAFADTEDNLPADLKEEILGQMDLYVKFMNLFTPDVKFLSEEEYKICLDVISQGERMDFQASPNTKEQLLAAITAAGIDAEMVESQYSRGAQDIKVSCGEFVIIITAGKIPGMLVACSPFFGIGFEKTENICVSHRPIDQVVTWLDLACCSLSPIANKVIPVWNVLYERLQKLHEAHAIMQGARSIHGVSRDAFGYRFTADCGKFELKKIMPDQMNDHWNLSRNTAPAKVASAAVEMLKMLAGIKSKVAAAE